MRTYNLFDLKNEFCRLNYRWPKFHIIGIRSKTDTPDSFDDQLYVVDNVDTLHGPFTATTNPGVAYLETPLNDKGSALVVPDQYIDLWKLGLHRNKYEALVQHNPITVFRDNDLDNKAEEQGEKESGYFGINLHRANAHVESKIIGKWSAGCQVVADPDDFETILDLCDNSGLEHFTYTLLKEFEPS